MLTMRSEVNTASPRFEIFAVMTEWLRLLSCLLPVWQTQSESALFFFFFLRVGKRSLLHVLS